MIAHFKRIAIHAAAVLLGIAFILLLSVAVDELNTLLTGVR